MSREKERKRFDLVGTIFKVFIILVIALALGKSDKVLEIIGLLPFAENCAKLFGLAINPKFQTSFNLFFDGYKNVMESLLAGTISWLFMRFLPLRLIVDILFPTDDPDNDPHDWSHSEKGINTRIKYFLIDLVATFAAGWLFGKLIVEGYVVSLLFHGALGPYSGGLDARYIIAAVVFSVIILAACLIRHLSAASHGTTFYLLVGGKLRVGFIGYFIYSIIKDMVTTFFNTLIIVLFYAILHDPNAAMLFLPLILMSLGILLLIKSVFL